MLYKTETVEPRQSENKSDNLIILCRICGSLLAVVLKVAMFWDTPEDGNFNPTILLSKPVHCFKEIPA
jgi:hypothetical protein